jgi:hypothetical protein
MFHIGGELQRLVERYVTAYELNANAAYRESKVKEAVIVNEVFGRAETSKLLNKLKSK